ncbi:hypothetical protein EJ110_NYTH16460 [Nymphaea thermarum]|nr:hypothetical protein EJ110_NYTH16460 [Nymphaea thermarum]
MDTEGLQVAEKALWVFLLHLVLAFLFVAILYTLFVSADSDPLVKGSTPVYRFSSLQSAAVLLFFLVLSLSILLSETTTLFPFPSEFFFFVASAGFALHSSTLRSSSTVTSGIQGKCEFLASNVSAATAALALVLACNPRIFVADLALGASVCLQGLWVLQTGLSLYVEAFIPEGCHRLLDVAYGVEGSTTCDLEDSRLRALALLDLVFVFHVIFVLVVVVAAYALAVKFVGIRRFGSYEALPTSSLSEGNHVQMKSLVKEMQP